MPAVRNEHRGVDAAGTESGASALKLSAIVR